MIPPIQTWGPVETLANHFSGLRSELQSCSIFRPPSEHAQTKEEFWEKRSNSAFDLLLRADSIALNIDPFLEGMFERGPVIATRARQAINRFKDIGLSFFRPEPWSESEREELAGLMRMFDTCTQELRAARTYDGDGDPAEMLARAIDTTIERLQATPSVLYEKIPEYTGGLDAARINRLAVRANLTDYQLLPILWGKERDEGSGDEIRYIAFNPAPGINMDPQRISLDKWWRLGVNIPVLVAHFIKRLETWSHGDSSNNGASVIRSRSGETTSLAETYVTARDASSLSGLSANTIRTRAHRDGWKVKKAGKMNAYPLSKLTEAWPNKKFLV